MLLLLVLSNPSIPNILTRVVQFPMPREGLSAATERLMSMGCKMGMAVVLLSGLIVQLAFMASLS